MTLKQSLADLLNQHSRENNSNTPDHILADYLYRCLENFEITSRAREQWFGEELSIGGVKPYTERRVSPVGGDGMPLEGAWIGIDLDGTLATYTGWQGELHIGMPIPRMAERVGRFIMDGYRIKIVTARVAEGAKNKANVSVDAIRTAIQDWTEKHFGHRFEVTNQKDFGMIELWDDRAIQVEANTGRRADGEA